MADVTADGGGLVDVCLMAPNEQVAYLKTRFDQHRKTKAGSVQQVTSNYADIKRVLDDGRSAGFIGLSAKAELKEALKGENVESLAELMHQANFEQSDGNQAATRIVRKDDAPTPYELYQKAVPVARLKKVAVISTRDDMTRTARVARQKWTRIGSAPPQELHKIHGASVADEMFHFKQQLALLKNQVLGLSQTPEVRALHKELADLHSRVQNQQAVIKGLCSKVEGENLSVPLKFRYSQVATWPTRNQPPRGGRVTLVFVLLDGVVRAAGGDATESLQRAHYVLHNLAMDFSGYCAAAREDASLWSFDNPEMALHWGRACHTAVASTVPESASAQLSCTCLRVAMQVGLADQRADPLTGAVWYSGAVYKAAAALAAACPSGAIALGAEAFAAVRNELGDMRVETYDDGALLLAPGSHAHPDKGATLRPPDTPDTLPAPLCAREPAGLPFNWKPEGVSPWPPCGAVTVMCCVVDKYPLIHAAHPDGGPVALGMCFDDLRRHLKEHHGYESRVEGHLLAAVFQSPQAALQCALQVQQSLSYRDWPEDVLKHPAAQCIMAGGCVVMRGLRLVVGLHTCETEAMVDALSGRHQFFGPEVSLAVAATSVGVGGEIIATEATTRLLQEAAIESSIRFGCPVMTPVRPVSTPTVSDAMKCFEVSNATLAHRRAYVGRGFHRGAVYVSCVCPVSCVV